VLFEIDPRPYQAQYDQALAVIALNEARLKLATANLDRAKKLMQTTPGVISQEEFNKCVGEKDEATAALIVAKAALEVHKLNLEFTKVKAPITGKIGRPTLTAGNLVNQDQTQLATLVSIDPVHVNFDLDERTYLRIARLWRDGKLKLENETQLPVQMGVADETGFSRQGKVDLVDHQVKPATGTIGWRAVFANPDGLLLPGMSARVRLTTSAPYKALLIVEKAVGSLPRGGKIVLVVNDKNVVETRPVKLGTLHDGLRVVTEGLKAEDKVVVSGLSNLADGDTVKAETVEMPGQKR
jgi:RND family efflux transporter MFP subunit